MPTAEEIVVLPPRGNAVLVAGPGTGKTGKIEDRVAFLLKAGVPARDVVLLTLTRETRRTLRTRVKNVSALTLHAYVLGRLNELGDASGKRVADEWETDQLVSPDVKLVAKLRGLNVDVRKVRKFLRRLGAGFRQSQLDEATLTAEERLLRDAFLFVRRFLVLRTFDELAQDCVQLLETGARLTHLSKAIIVDEYQDLTAAELKLIQLVADRAGAGVFACGDDHQAIYGFRQADLLSLSNFGVVYGTTPAFMSISHRCPRSVVLLSEALASRMPIPPGLDDRPPLESDPDRTDGGKVRVLSFSSMWMEVSWISTHIQHLRTTAQDDSIMVIVPRNLPGYVKYLNEAVQEQSHPFHFVDSRSPLPFQETEAFRMWLALLRLVESADDQLAWRALLGMVPRLGSTTITQLYESKAATLSAALRARDPLDTKVRRFRADVQSFVDRLQEAPDAATVIATLQDAGAHWQVDVPATLWDEIQAAPVDDEIPEPTPEDVAWKIILQRSRRAAGGDVGDLAASEDAVLVYTVFQAKGQQADHVFVAGAYSDAFQDEDVSQTDGLRRLYVAITRARKTLTVSLAQDLTGSPLHAFRETNAPIFHPDFHESCAEVGYQTEPDPPE